MPPKQFNPGRPRAVSPNLDEEDMHLAPFAGLDSPGKNSSRKESKKILHIHTAAPTDAASTISSCTAPD
jgi:hypothetical protein